jgi:phage gpG-like protein
MSGVAFSIHLDGAALVDQELGGVVGRLHDLTPLMDIFGMTLEADIADNFEGEHSPEGVPWQPSLRVIEHGGKTLQKSRRLALSITHNAGPRHVEVGTNLVYARPLQEGFTGPQRVASHTRTMREVFGVKLAAPIEVTVGAFTRQARLVARPFVGASPAAREEMIAQAGDYLVGHA